MENRRQNEMRMEKIEATVTPQTAESIRKSQQETGLTVGELIDRMTLYFRPKEAKVALQLILEEISIIVSELSDVDTEQVLSEVAATLAALLPMDKLNDLLDRTIEKQQVLLHGCMDDADEYTGDAREKGIQ